MRANVPPAPPAPSRPCARCRDRSLWRSCSRVGHLLREELGRQQPLEHVVVANVALAPREADHAGDGVRLEHRAHRVLRQPEPVLRLAALALEVGRGERAVRPDPFQHLLGCGSVVGQRGGVKPRAFASDVHPVPGELAPPGRTTAPCWSSRRSRGARRARRTRRARSRRRGHAASGRGSGPRPRSGRTGSSRACG